MSRFNPNQIKYLTPYVRKMMVMDLIQRRDKIVCRYFYRGVADCDMAIRAVAILSARIRIIESTDESRSIAVA